MSFPWASGEGEPTVHRSLLPWQLEGAGALPALTSDRKWEAASKGSVVAPSMRIEGELP